MESSVENSAVGRMWVPALFLSLWKRIPLLTGDGADEDVSRSRGSRRGTKKREREREPWAGSPVRASATDTSESVALGDHLNPSSLCSGPKLSELPITVARVSV